MQQRDVVEISELQAHMSLRPLTRRPPEDAQFRTDRGLSRVLNSALVFAIPYLLAFVLLVIYPVAYGLWLGHDPSSYDFLVNDPTYVRTAINTLIFVGLAVNLKLAAAVFISGLFMRSTAWKGIILILFMLPWVVPALPAFMSVNFMLNGMWGTLNGLIKLLTPFDGTYWLADPQFAFISIVYGHIWKWLPFWTLVLIAARTAIPSELYEAAAVDGAAGMRMFRSITFPLIKPTYITALLLSSIWTLGDYNTIHFITGGGPADTTQVLATLGIQYAFERGLVPEGVAVALTALPLLVPLLILLIRRLRRAGA